MSFSVEILTLLAALLVALVIPFVLPWSRKRPVDPFEISIIFTANYFLEFWLKPVLAISNPGRFTALWFQAVPDASNDGTITLALLLALLGILVFYVGYYGLPWGRMLSRLLPRPVWPWSGGRVRLALIASCSVSAAGLLYFLRRGSYSAAYLALNRGEVVQGVGTYAWLFVLSTVLSFVVFFVYLRQVRMRGWLRALASTGASAVALAALAVFAARGNLLLIIGSVLMLQHYCVRRFSILKAALLGVGLVAFSAAFLVLRGWLVIGQAPPFPHLYDAAVADMVSLTTGWEGFLLVLGSYPAVYPFYHGALMGGDLLWLLPRALWPGKPEMYGAFLVERDVLPTLWSPTAGVGTFESFSPLGVGYADFGIAGAMLAMFLHGVFWRMVYAYLWRDRSRVTPPSAALYGLAVLSLPAYARGFVGGFLALLVIWLPIAWTASWLGRGGRPQQMEADLSRVHMAASMSGNR